VGLKSDGSVVAVGGSYDEGHCDVGSWMDITQVTTGKQHTVGLEYDGAMVGVGRNTEGQCDV